MGMLSGATQVTSAGTRVQISNSPRRVLYARAQGRDGNAGTTYLGGSTVSNTNGWSLVEPTGTIHGNVFEMWFTNTGPRRTTVPLSDFYVDAATNNDYVEWLFILE